MTIDTCENYPQCDCSAICNKSLDVKNKIMEDYWKDKPEELKELMYSIVDDEGRVLHPHQVAKLIEAYSDEFAKKFMDWYYNVKDVHPDTTGMSKQEVINEFKKTLL